MKKDWKFISTKSEAGKALAKFLELHVQQDCILPVNVEEIEEMRKLGLQFPQWQDLKESNSNENIAYIIGNRTFLMSKEEFFNEVE